jgi:hypothetical protein
MESAKTVYENRAAMPANDEPRLPMGLGLAVASAAASMTNPVDESNKYEECLACQ